MPKPRILFILESLKAGGAQRHTFDLGQCLSQEFAPVFLHLDAEIAPAIRAILHGEIEVSNAGRLRNPISWLRLWRQINESKPSLIIAVNQIPGLVAALGRRMRQLSAPIVSIFHSTNIETLAGQIRTVPYTALSSSFDAVVFVSEKQKAFWEAKGLKGKHNILIRNGINTVKFRQVVDRSRNAMRESLGYKDTDFVIGMVAGFRPEKNHQQALDAFYALRSKGIEAKLMFVGGGPTEGLIKELCRQRNVEKHVLFAGEQEHVADWIPAMDIGILPSTSVETLSLAALEIMAMGIPMIMSDIGGASEIVSHGVDGYIVPRNSEPRLTEHLEMCIDACHRATMGKRARIKVETQFAHEAMVTAYRSLLRQLIPPDAYCWSTD